MFILAFELPLKDHEWLAQEMGVACAGAHATTFMVNAGLMASQW